MATLPMTWSGDARRHPRPLPDVIVVGQPTEVRRPAPPTTQPPTVGVVRRIEGLGQDPGASGGGGILSVVTAVGSVLTKLADALFGYKQRKAEAEAAAAVQAARAQQTTTMLIVAGALAFVIIVVLMIMVMGRK